MLKLKENHVRQLFREVAAAAARPEEPDRQRGYFDTFKPVFEEIDWEGGREGDFMAPVYRKRYAELAKRLAATDLANHFRGGEAAVAQEASTAGTDLPTFTRQLLMTITRAYPQLFSLQLFGTIPMQGPTARVNFKDYLFDSTFTGSTPNIAVGDRTDDMTKWNPDYLKAPEGTLANKLRETYKFMTITSADYRVVSEWSDAYADDAASVYDDDVDASQAASRAWNMARLIDRTMVNALVANVPSANKNTFTLQPTNSPNYANLAPGDKLSYDEGIYRDGLLKTQHLIRIARKFNNDAEATWAICGTDFAYSISRLQMFQPIQSATAEMALQTGPMRDLGSLKSVNIRFIIDPALTINSSTNVCVLGHKPMNRGDVGIWWAPYINMQPTRDFYDPSIGTTTKAVRSRFAILQPNTGQEPASSQLADIYGQLTCS